MIGPYSPTASTASKRPVFLLLVAAGAGLALAAAPAALAQAGSRVPHVVFVTGDEEYRSEESMPMLAKILARDHGFKVTVCYAVDKNGAIDPNNLEHIEDLEALESADLMVMFTRFRKLPEGERARIMAYAESGRPMVGFRTATHAFRYPDGPLADAMNEAWPAKVFGQKWITHHGHFGDGMETLTRVEINPEFRNHPILRGVIPFSAYSWLYHVEGGGDQLSGDCQRLLMGEALKSSHEKETARFPRTNPVAWTRSYQGSGKSPSRVFFTTLGHPFDFKLEPMRRLALNGIFWALGKESEIPADGLKAEIAGPYEPNNSGFGKVFKAGLRPEPIGAGK